MELQFRKITDLDIKGKTLFIRTDMNVPMDENFVITDDTRIRAGLQTIKYALDQGAFIVLATHLGRPIEGNCTRVDSVTPIANRLAELLNVSVPVVENLNSLINFKFTNTNIVMLENVRCNIGEKANSKQLGEKYALLCDIFVHDAFATAHRAEASTDAIGYCVKDVCAGFLMSEELNALSDAILMPKRPVVAIVGGSKVSTKLEVLENLADNVDYLIVGGGILNTFLVAAGFNVAKSLYEPNLVENARSIIQKMSKRGAMIPLPDNVVVSSEFNVNATPYFKHISELAINDMILDIGVDFANSLADIIQNSGTVIWNGPLGVFEFEQFSNGTKIVAQSIANSDCYSLAGGGDTIAAINKFNLYDKISYVSTAGGALLEFLGGAKLPALKLLAANY